MTRSVDGDHSPECVDEMDRVEVYLRLKPVSPGEIDVSEIQNSKTVIIDPQLSGQGHLLNQRAVRCTFEHIFGPRCDQQEVFRQVALPSVRDVLCGKSALIFMYGVTGSGKTHTMTGNPGNAGILPRTLDVLFNSIPTHLKAMKNVFKPDNVNGYDVRRIEDAMMDRQSTLLASGSRAYQTPGIERTPAKKKQRQEQNAWAKRDRLDYDHSKVVGDIPDYCKVAVFVQYVEIYNNCVYDLLEEEALSVQARARGPQSKNIRDDASKNTYVFGATEVEVENADEAMEVFIRGQSRKRVAHTQMNAESSRSHSVFMIKLVQAPVSEKTGELVQKKEFITVTQFNLVDLAGSERAHKTAATGDRLREASNINNSLMCLRSCLEMLRDNQLKGTNKMVPYRESKLTHLFKSFFEGCGKVKMVVCVNPRAEDCAETLEVMKFSETAQEVEMQRVQINRVQQYIEPSPAQSIEDIHMAMREPVSIPGCLSLHTHTEADLIAMQKLCADGAKEVAAYKGLFEEKGVALRESVKAMNDELQSIKSRLSAREKDVKQKAKTIQDLMSKRSQEAREKDQLREKLIELEAKLESVAKRNAQLEDSLRRAKDEQHRIKRDEATKRTKEREALVAKMDRLLNEQKSEAMKQGAQLAKANLLKDIIGTNELENIDTLRASRTPKRPPPMKQQRTQTFHTLETKATSSTKKTTAPSSSEPDLSDADAYKTPSAHPMRTRRRSQSNNNRWLEHTDGETPDDAIMQPLIKRKKSVSKLESKDLENVDNYALVTKEGSNIQIVKGDVLVSPTGGTAVVFTGVETLSRKKVGSSKRKESEDESDERAAVGPMDTKKRCGIAIEGHPYMRNVVHRNKN